MPRGLETIVWTYQGSRTFIIQLICLVSAFLLEAHDRVEFALKFPPRVKLHMSTWIIKVTIKWWNSQNASNVSLQRNKQGLDFILKSFKAGIVNVIFFKYRTSI